MILRLHPSRLCGSVTVPTFFTATAFVCAT